MDVRHIRNLRSALVDVLEGNLGLVRIQPGVFEHGVFAEMPLHKQQTKAKNSTARHYFDVKFRRAQIHPNSPVSNYSNQEWRIYAFEVLCWTHKRTTARDDERTSILDYIQADGDEITQALKAPAALETTLSGEQTLVVSGFVLGPDGTGTPEQTDPIEDWENNLVRWSVLGVVVLNIPQNAPA